MLMKTDELPAYKTKEYRQQYSKNYYVENKEKIKRNVSNYRNANKEKKALCDKNWRIKNKAKCADNDRNYREANKEKIKQQFDEWYQQNKEHFHSYQVEYRRNRAQKDPLYKTKLLLRNTVRGALGRLKQDRNKQRCNTLAALGCTWEEAKIHFEELFEEGMTWNNHGRGPKKWNVDHIKPVSSFTLKDVHMMNHISNLQPLWFEDNMAKGDAFAI